MLSKIRDWATLGAVIVILGVVLVGVGGNNQSQDNLGASGSRFPRGISADSTSPVAGEVRGSTLTMTGNSTLTGSVTFKEASQNVSTAKVLTAADSGKTFYLSGGAAAYTLSATSTPGTWFRFVIGGAITGNATVVSAGSVNAIEGTLIVAGAVVDCDAEDTITFVADGENLGDYFEIRTDGTNWFLGSSGALTTAKLTCSAT